MLVSVELPNVADCYQALVAVAGVALAGYVLAFNEPLKGLLSKDAAHLLLALAGAASLLHLRRVYAVEPDLSIAYVDGVTVNDTGRASDVGVGSRYGQEED